MHTIPGRFLVYCWCCTFRFYVDGVTRVMTSRPSWVWCCRRPWSTSWSTLPHISQSWTCTLRLHRFDCTVWTAGIIRSTRTRLVGGPDRLRAGQGLWWRVAAVFYFHIQRRSCNMIRQTAQSLQYHWTQIRCQGRRRHSLSFYQSMIVYSTKM